MVSLQEQIMEAQDEIEELQMRLFDKECLLAALEDSLRNTRAVPVGNGGRW